MEARHTGKRWTYSEFARLPEPGSTRYEVIDDELVVTPAPTVRHQWMVTNLLARLFDFAKAKQLGKVFPAPLDVLFGEGDYLEPDIVFVSTDRAHLLSDRGVEGPPDLVVEVLSPSTAERDRGIKLERYRLYGVPEYWVVGLDARSIEVWKLGEGAKEAETLRSGDTLRWALEAGGPTLEIDVGELFAD